MNPLVAPGLPGSAPRRHPWAQARGVVMNSWREELCQPRHNSQNFCQLIWSWLFFVVVVVAADVLDYFFVVVAWCVVLFVILIFVLLFVLFFCVGWRGNLPERSWQPCHLWTRNDADMGGSTKLKNHETYIRNYMRSFGIISICNSDASRRSRHSGPSPSKHRGEMETSQPEWLRNGNQVCWRLKWWLMVKLMVGVNGWD